MSEALDACLAMTSLLKFLEHIIRFVSDQLQQDLARGRRASYHSAKIDLRHRWQLLSHDKAWRGANVELRPSDKLLHRNPLVLATNTRHRLGGTLHVEAARLYVTKIAWEVELCRQALPYLIKHGYHLAPCLERHVVSHGCFRQCFTEFGAGYQISHIGVLLKTCEPGGCPGDLEIAVSMLRQRARAPFANLLGQLRIYREARQTLARFRWSALPCLPQHASLGCLRVSLPSEFQDAPEILGNAQTVAGQLQHRASLDLLQRCLKAASGKALGLDLTPELRSQIGRHTQRRPVLVSQVGNGWTCLVHAHQRLPA